MTIRQKIFVLILVIPLAQAALYSFEAGVQIGMLSQPSRFCYGFSAGGGLLLPMVKMEGEYYRISNYAYQGITLAVKLRPRLAKFAPYALLGVGTEFDQFTLRSDNHRWYSFFGGGLHVFMNDLFSLRFDVRYQSYSSSHKVRLSAGIFLHI